jgi:hypothetical protein
LSKADSHLTRRLFASLVRQISTSGPGAGAAISDAVVLYGVQQASLGTQAATRSEAPLYGAIFP